MRKIILFTLIMVLGSIQVAVAGKYPPLNTPEVVKLSQAEGVILVDARAPDAFNGWPLRNETRGGHIPGATNLAASWVTRELPRTAEVTAAKHFEECTTIIIYGYEQDQAVIVADWLVSQKISAEKIRIYTDGIAAWTKDGHPVDGLPRRELIVPAQWVKEELENNSLHIIEASWGKGEKYEKAHIPGAVHLNTDLLESNERNWNYLPPATLEKNLLALGVTADTKVVLYGEHGIDAARAAVAMMYMGIKDVRLLNGGLDAWQAAGYEIATGVELPVPVQEFGVSTPRHPELVSNIPEAKRILADEQAELVSIRSWAEYIGETSGYSYIKPKGRIQGAVWGHGGKDAYNMDHFRNPDNTMRDYTEIAEFWAEWGITPDKEVAFHCGTGWRASETLLYALAMGYRKASLFDDGWYIWSMDPDNPFATGDPR